MSSLFGDLPSASKQDISQKQKDKEQVGGATYEGHRAAKQNAAGTDHNPPAITTTSPKLSLTKQLGNAGTTFAFVPNALKLKAKQQYQQKKKDGGMPKVKAAEVSVVVAPSTNEKMNKPATATAAVIREDDVREGTPLHAYVKEGTNESDNKVEMKYDDEEEEEIRQLHLAVAEAVEKMNESAQHSANINYDYSMMQVGGNTKKSNSPRVVNIIPYDPMIPNDYLAYKDGQKKRRRREELERSARETLRQQHVMRERIEEERKKVEQAGVSGGRDYSKIWENRQKQAVEIQAASDVTTSGRGRGRGRGRGAINIPAWLVKKQQKETKAQEKSLGNKATELRPSDREQFADATASRLVVLRNMVVPDEIDNELSDEVKEECEDKCGKVVSVKIKTPDDRHQQVRVLVVFEESTSAVKAASVFHGRMFGGRQLSAYQANESQEIYL